MAEVQLALARGPGGFAKLVVVKLVHERLAVERRFVDMLLDEARLAAMLKHPNVVDTYDIGFADGRYFIAMEYLEGEPLLSVLRAGRDGHRLDPLSTARVIADTAEGLHAAHELRTLSGEHVELVHHDVSLGNIVVLYNGHVKLVDFGVAKAAQLGPRVPGTLTTVLGKHAYMAPEKLRGTPGDRRCDLWSLGVVAWEALTLRRLFKGATEAETVRQVMTVPIPRPSAINREVPPAFDAIVLRALERDEARRYATAKQIADDLEAALRDAGYGRTNDRLASHMRATFATHLAARRQLVQQVTSAGTPTPDVVEAAFAEPRGPVAARDAAPDAALPPDDSFRVRFRPSTAELAAIPASPSRRPARTTGQLLIDSDSAPVPRTKLRERSPTVVPQRPPWRTLALAAAALVVGAIIVVVAYAWA